MRRKASSPFKDSCYQIYAHEKEPASWARDGMLRYAIGLGSLFSATCVREREAEKSYEYEEERKSLTQKIETLPRSWQPFFLLNFISYKVCAPSNVHSGCPEQGRIANSISV